MPLVIGNCTQLANGMSYDVPGGGKKGSNFVDSSDWVAPFNGRMLVASSHQHGGGKYHTLDSRTCKRRLFKAPVYHGLAKHPYNTIRPILHEPGPIGTGAYATRQGHPDRARARCCGARRSTTTTTCTWPRWASGPPGSSRTTPSRSAASCPSDIVEINKPKRYDRTPNYDLEVPQLSKPRGAFGAFDGSAARGRRRLLPARPASRPRSASRSPGASAATEPHSVTVANGPRGFSSVYWGQRRAAPTRVTPKVKGTYKLVCLVHPTTMARDAGGQVGR